MFQKKLFGQRMLELREKRALSQKAVADILGITRTQISDMENGKNTTTIENVVKICEHYKISSDYLLGY